MLLEMWTVYLHDALHCLDGFYDGSCMRFSALLPPSTTDKDYRVENIAGLLTIFPFILFSIPKHYCVKICSTKWLK